MPKYRITDPQSGKTVTVSGTKPPTQADADTIFSEAGLRPTAQPSSQSQMPGGVMKGVNALGRILNLPSAGAGGILESGRQFNEGTYQPPEIGPTVPFGKGQFNLGSLIPPTAVGAVRGMRDNSSVMEQLPKTVGLDPNSAPGMAVGFAGELATPDFGDAILGTKLVQKGLNNISPLVSKFVKKTGEEVGKSGEELVLKGLKPSPGQLRKFTDMTGEDLSKFLTRKGITGNFEQKAIEFISKGQDEFDDIALRSGREIDPQDLFKGYQDSIDSLTKGKSKLRNVNAKTASFLKDSLATLRENVSEILKPNGKIDVGELTQLRRAIDDEIPVSEFVKAAKGEEVSAAVKERFLLNDIVQRATEDLKTPDGLTLKQLGQELRNFHEFRKIAEKQGNLGRGSNIFGLIKANIGAAGAVVGGFPGFLGGLLVSAASSNPEIIGGASKALQKTGSGITSMADPIGQISELVAKGGARIGKEIGITAANQNLTPQQRQIKAMQRLLDKENLTKQTRTRSP